MDFPLDISRLKGVPDRAIPLAPYIFILTLEVLSEMVRKNKNIKGIKVEAKEIKRFIYAGDTTYFLQDLSSLQELKDTISQASSKNGLFVNYEKSEIAWMNQSEHRGSSTNTDKLNWIDLNNDAIKILGTHFSHTKSLSESLNFDLAFQIFKNLLNIEVAFYFCTHPNSLYEHLYCKNYLNKINQF